MTLPKMTRIHHVHLLVNCFFISLIFGLVAADLKSDLREFSALIPRRRIGYIAARHYILDQNFRNALNYIRSPYFQDTWRQIRETPEFSSLIDYVTQNTSSLDVTQLVENVPNRLRSFQLPAKVPVDMLIQQRNLGNFLKDVVRSLPRSRITSLLTKKVQEGGDFAKIYKAARSTEFYELVNESRHSKNLAQPLQKLNENSINVDEVIEIGFKVLKWGP